MDAIAFLCSLTRWNYWFVIQRASSGDKNGWYVIWIVHVVVQQRVTPKRVGFERELCLNATALAQATQHASKTFCVASIIIVSK
jgi:hypothetical protein